MGRPLAISSRDHRYFGKPHPQTNGFAAPRVFLLTEHELMAMSLKLSRDWSVMELARTVAGAPRTTDPVEVSSAEGGLVVRP